MKKVRLIASALLLSATAIGTITTVTSCGSDEACAVGYEGKDCTTEIRTALLGTYNASDVNDADASDSEAYIASVTASSAVSNVNIANFGDFFSNSQIVIAGVSKSGNTISFTISAQQPDNLYTVSGSGTFDTSTKKINIKYSLKNAAGQILNYTGTWTKN